jgi:hypothetical protein
MVGGIHAPGLACQQSAGLILEGFTAAPDLEARSARRRRLQQLRTYPGFQCPFG